MFEMTDSRKESTEKEMKKKRRSDFTRGRRSLRFSAAGFNNCYSSMETKMLPEEKLVLVLKLALQDFLTKLNEEFHLETGPVDFVSAFVEDVTKSGLHRELVKDVQQVRGSLDNAQLETQIANHNAVIHRLSKERSDWEKILQKEMKQFEALKRLLEKEPLIEAVDRSPDATNWKAEKESLKNMNLQITKQGKYLSAFLPKLRMCDIYFHENYTSLLNRCEKEMLPNEDEVLTFREIFKLLPI